MIVLKCRKCRLELLDSEHSPLLTCHDLKVENDSLYHPSSETDCRDNIDSIYLQELGLPEWILASINEEDWQKGKLKCPNCTARLGSFDFISGRKCHCNKFVLPPVHIIKSKVDHQLVESKGDEYT